ncbi:hypothetical protein Sthe_2113 [Sphaerobacter thermophilus DSM 20745]|uniref:Uncharacterized protein n=1 Tax=Sphaerobacter thermophilus (strain ATCC 49802 / DSM 20745 / KCCM 41009 / NCIMB 13125 / S 6022) TaxID=479434 RepID=D1C5Y8_SPHTD|nr:hypothetical protein Sthe_2113 [Sphaerobacter thermophilus DSM 20745]
MARAQGVYPRADKTKPALAGWGKTAEIPVIRCPPVRECPGLKKAAGLNKESPLKGL